MKLSKSETQIMHDVGLHGFAIRYFGDNRIRISHAFDNLVEKKQIKLMPRPKDWYHIEGAMYYEAT